MNNRWLMIKQLDRQLKEWQSVSKRYGRPRAGWVKTVRVALSMSVEQLGSRLGLKRARISQLENAEVHDAVTLHTLREAANAMGCEFVYAIVPKGDSTLEDIIKLRAEQVAKERVASVAHTMSLEAQSVDSRVLKIQQDELAKSLMEDLNKKFWAFLERDKTQEQKSKNYPERRNKFKNALIREKENNLFKKLTSPSKKKK